MEVGLGFRCLGFRAVWLRFGVQGLCSYGFEVPSCRVGAQVSCSSALAVCVVCHGLFLNEAKHIWCPLT